MTLVCGCPLALEEYCSLLRHPKGASASGGEFLNCSRPDMIYDDAAYRPLPYIPEDHPPVDRF